MKQYSKNKKGGSNMFEELYANIKKHQISNSESSYGVAMESVKDIFIDGQSISELSDEELYELLKNVPTEDDSVMENSISNPIAAVLAGEDVDEHTLESVCELLLGKDDN